MKKSLYILISLAMLTSACSLPGIVISVTTQSTDSVFTEAAQTVAAELTRVALLASPTPNIPTPTSTLTNTFTPIPTNTTIPSPTKTPIPCNLATWDPATIDVTIPDNTKMVPNQVFSKTWRIRNIGSCSWNSSYLLVFDYGDGMGVTSGYTQQLTTGIVNPGQWVDLTVNNLKAPATQGTYTGYWLLRDPGGVIFGITPSAGTFVVKIVVVTQTTITLLPVFGESGKVRSDGVVSTGELSVGDSSLNTGIEMFLSFNISGIPSNATIIEVKHDMRNSITMGNPFSLGVLNLYQQDYGTLDSTDYVSALSATGKLADWSAAASLSIVEVSPKLKVALQAKLGSSRIQFRLQYNSQTNSNGIVDKLVYGPIPLISNPINNPALIVTYTTP